MRNFSIGPREMLASLWRHRDLVTALTRREIAGRYRGSMMGMLWSFINPVCMLAVYTFVFSVVFKARWSAGTESRTEFALVLFAGMLVFGLFSECINRAPGLILAHVSYVKKVVFPLEILPFVSLCTALFHLLVGVFVWLIFHLALFGTLHPTLLLFPLVLLPLVLFTMGLSWMLAALGVYLRDVGQVIGLFTTALLFLSPVFYPVSALPAEYRTLLHLNPLTPVIEQTHQVLFWGRLPDFGNWALALLAGSLIAWLGFAWFQKTRKGFADVL